MSFNPPITDLHSAFDDVSKLLAIIADPALHRARLEELVKQEAATKAAIAELNDMKSETLRLHGTAKATNIVSDNRKAALDKREVELDKREVAVDQSEARLSDASLKRREDAADAKEEALRRQAERLEATRKELDARVVKINNALR